MAGSSTGWMMTGAGAAALLGLAGLGIWMGSASRNPYPLDEVVDLSHDQALAEAVDLYRKRGGYYTQDLRSRNDCSSFVRDYLRAKGRRAPHDLTTRLMASARFMASLGCFPQSGDPDHGDIFVFRYKTGSQGHCGVVAMVDGQEVFIHNAESAGGLVVEDRAAFQSRLAKVGTSWDRVDFYAS